jgi:hypothetical protein
MMETMSEPSGREPFFQIPAKGRLIVQTNVVLTVVFIVT